MLDATVFFYMAFGTLFAIAVPLILCLCIIWYVLNFVKKMTRSLLK